MVDDSIKFRCYFFVKIAVNIGKKKIFFSDLQIEFPDSSN